MRIEDKLAILAGAAKYDVSCASSGSRRKNTGRRLGNAAASGICHTYTEDGRCVSLLKILHTNACIYDCAYCANRCSNDLQRASFTSGEIIDLTIEFYRRNYIEGLFLSSGIMRSPDDTMERMVRTAKGLREQGFNGYVHLKCVPHASERLITQAGQFADRLSVNIELPSEESLRRLTQEKTYDSVLTPMTVIQQSIAQAREDRIRMQHALPFAPAGQSTQLIVGASPETDLQVLKLARRLYGSRCLKRVYYSAYVPVGRAAAGLPDIDQPPLQRENRLYQADWLMRLYGFTIDEIIDKRSPFLDLDKDPKQTFAARHPEIYPVDINTADHEMLLRVPGIGLQSARRIVQLRRRGRIRFEHLRQMGVVVSRAQSHITCDGLPNNRWQGASLLPGVGATKSRSPQTTRVWLTDGTFEGLLTALFDSYHTAHPPNGIASSDRGQSGLFEHRIPIRTDIRKSERVWKGLKKRLGAGRRRQIFEAYLSGKADVATTIYRYVRDKVPSANQIKTDIQLSCHIEVEKLARKVRREAHRMKGFIRFQQIEGGCYHAVVEPQYDVLPLIRRHFESRFADQAWIIYDCVRKYGLCYDLQSTREIQIDSDLAAQLTGESASDHIFQMLWKRYFKAVNIAPRSNPKLHLQQLPRRYWRYLPEKRP